MWLTVVIQVHVFCEVANVDNSIHVFPASFGANFTAYIEMLDTAFKFRIPVEMARGKL